MPPLAVVRFEPAADHYILQEHSVLILLLRNPFVIGVRNLAEIVEGASHINLFTRLHIEQCQVDRASPAVARLTRDISFSEEFLLLKIRIKERLHAQVQVIHAP